MQDGLRVQHLDPGRGQLDGQGQPVQARADLGHRRGVGVGELEARIDGPSPLDEQLDGFELLERVGGGRLRGVGKAHRRDRVLAFGVKMQRLATGDQDADARCGGQQLADVAPRVQDLFEVVQQQQGMVVAEVFDQDLDGLAGGVLPEAEGPGHGGHDQRRIADRRE